jgi:polyisoprenoid-binding protein YceI
MRTLVQVALMAALLGGAACCSAFRSPPAPRSAPSAPPQPGAVAAGDILLTPANTKIEFVGSSERTSQAGSFQQFTGTFHAAGSDLSSARLSFDIDMDSTTTSIALLTRHLKAADFFDVKQFPRASFASTSIQASTTPGATHVITGQLTLHGVTKTISAPANLSLADGVLTLSSRFVIHQSEFGMTEAVKKTRDEVPVTVTIRAARS